MLVGFSEDFNGVRSALLHIMGKYTVHAKNIIKAFNMMFKNHRTFVLTPDSEPINLQNQKWFMTNTPP